MVGIFVITMNLEFDHLEFANFRSFLGRHSFSFNDVGLHFMRGRNEVEPRLTANDVGKSTTFDCMSWVLYGRTAKGLKNADIRPWSAGKKSTSGMVTVRTDGKPHQIERGADPNHIRLDGTDCAQTHIDELLQMNYEIFSHTVLLGQGKPLFFDLQPMAKMELFSEVLNLERWDVRAKSASDKTKDLQSEHIQISATLNSTQLIQDDLIKTFDSIKTKSTTWSDDQIKKLKSLRLDLDATKTELERITKIKNKADLAYESASVEAKALATKSRESANKMGTIFADHQSAKSKYDSLRSDRKQLQDEIKSLDNDGKCTRCGQTLKGTGLDKHIGIIKKKMEEMDFAISQQEKIVNERARRKTKLLDLVDEQSKHRDEFQKKADAAESQLRISATDCANCEARCQTLAEQIKSEEDAENPYHDQLQQLRRRKTELAERTKELAGELDVLEKKIDNTKYWVRGFKDIRLFVIEEVLHELELATNAMLPDVGLDEWEVVYNIEKETKSGTTQRGLNATILSPHNDEPVRWEVWGGGVGQRLRIVSALALSEVLLNYAGVNPDLEVLDEPTQHLSMAGVRDLCGFLAQRADTLGKKIHFIDHRSIESTHFSSVTTVVKDKKGSFIDV